MLTIWILFKSFKRVYIDEISRWYLVFLFFFPVLWIRGSGIFIFLWNLGKLFWNVQCNLPHQSSRNNGHYLLHLQKGGRLCRVPGEGEHELLIQFKISPYITLKCSTKCMYVLSVFAFTLVLYPSIYLKHKTNPPHKKKLLLEPRRENKPWLFFHSDLMF